MFGKWETVKHAKLKIHPHAKYASYANKPLHFFWKVAKVLKKWKVTDVSCLSCSNKSLHLISQGEIQWISEFI